MAGERKNRVDFANLWPSRSPAPVAPKKGLVARPLKSSQFAIEHVTGQAVTGSRDVVATQKSSAADAWDELTRAPNQWGPKRSQFKGQLVTTVRDGVEHDQWQYELCGDEGIWFYVEGRTVKEVNVFTRHPNQTKEASALKSGLEPCAIPPAAPNWYRLR